MTKYKLINPYIDSKMKTSVNASSELQGAGKIYEKILAPIFITSAPEFNFTIEGEGKLFHYTVRETVKGDSAKFKIEEFDGKVDNKKFLEKFNEIKTQSGGKSKHRHRSKYDDDSSSSSSSDSPSYYSINRYCYSPYIYTPYINTGISYSYTLQNISPAYLLPNSFISIYGYPVLI